MNNKDGKSSWGSAVSLEKRELFEEREMTILLLKQQFPGIPQSALHISKIQYNRDVGQSILESYSRILEILPFTVISRIEDALYARLSNSESIFSRVNRNQLTETSPVLGEKFPNPEEEDYQTLWVGIWIKETELKKTGSTGNLEGYLTDEDGKSMSKPDIVTKKKFSYTEKLENLGGLSSPTARH
ncbi:hypothetical protein HHK36_006186 [Tetracentron sinense]|uniref:PRONE domain-containing protein n=1 Tax=Tetracentron sinense TaxID=13715 RepID=A0A834ZP15_TETSI|nr:hypothetical protein HHK36_006186 [Tetracentron sinense]